MYEVTMSLSLRGFADLVGEGAGNLAVAGTGLKAGRKTPIRFGLLQVPDSRTDLHWHVKIGFSEEEFEETRFWIEVSCVKQYFDDLLEAVRRGYLDNIGITIGTTMWAKTHGPERTLYLAPDTKGKSVRPEDGKMWWLIWEEKFGLHPEARLTLASLVFRYLFTPIGRRS
jgi:hypothetical protein